MRCLLCDFDGVLCKLDQRAAIKHLNAEREKLLISPSDILSRFFYSNPYYKEIDTGSWSYDEMLIKIQDTSWIGSEEEWLYIWQKIWECYETDLLILDRLNKLLENGILVRLVSDNHRDFRSWMSTRPELASLERNLICSAEVGFCKPSKEIFMLSITGFSVSFSDTCFIDDNVNNILAAKNLGIKSIHHLDSQTTLKKLEDVFLI